MVPATEAHCVHVAAHARPADVAELQAGSGMTPAQVLEYGLRISALCYTALVDGEPVAVVGVTPLSVLAGKGCPWMVATSRVDRHARQLLEVSRPVVDLMAEQFPLLANFVDNRNVKAHRWLRWLGFHLHPPVPHGREGRLFRLFVRAS